MAIDDIDDKNDDDDDDSIDIDDDIDIAYIDDDSDDEYEISNHLISAQLSARHNSSASWPSGSLDQKLIKSLSANQISILAIIRLVDIMLVGTSFYHLDTFCSSVGENGLTFKIKIISNNFVFLL